jgi:diaminopimelate decarboxylase
MTTSEMCIQGLSVPELGETFGTPLYVYDADALRATFGRLRDGLDPDVEILLSLKANPNVSICSYLASLGAGAEVSSLTELRTALWAGVPAHRILFLGPGKTRQELVECLTAGLGAIVCESVAELRLLEGLAEQVGVGDVPVLLRINPDFHTKGSGLAMGGKPRQFGIDVEILRKGREVLDGLRRLRVLGTHVYMGTRFLNHEDLLHNTEQILAMAEELTSSWGLAPKIVDVGGGFGVAYFDNEYDLDADALIEGINTLARRFLGTHLGCRLITELGRYLTATAGLYIVRALYVKESMGEEFIVADGGTNHHMAAVGIGSFVKRNFPMCSVSRYHDARTRKYTVTGPLCTPHDVLGKQVMLPPVAAGDLLAVERSGAYGPSASPGWFLGHGFPAEVLVHGGVAHLVRDRDRPEDLLAKQHLVEFATTAR